MRHQRKSSFAAQWLLYCFYASAKTFTVSQLNGRSEVLAEITSREGLETGALVDISTETGKEIALGKIRDVAEKFIKLELTEVLENKSHPLRRQGLPVR